MSGNGKNRQIVDKNDNLIGHKSKEEFDPSCDIYRATGLWLRNSKGEVLLAQRSPKKANSGGKWGPAVGGTVENDETYEDNIIKEAQEEIGLSGVKFTPGKKYYIEAAGRKFFATYFYATIDREAEYFELEDAVEAVKWVDESWLLGDILQHRDIYLPGMVENIDDIIGDCR